MLWDNVGGLCKIRLRYLEDLLIDDLEGHLGLICAHVGGKGF